MNHVSEIQTHQNEILGSILALGLQLNWLEHLLCKQEVVGSFPTSSTPQIYTHKCYSCRLCVLVQGLFIYRGYFVLQAQYASQEVYVNRFSSELGQQLRWSERKSEKLEVVDRYHVVPLFKLPIKRRKSITKRKHCFIVCLVELPVKVVLLYWTMV